jgi:poly-gamma-glutamate synthesis protein (capsule biosynthesis protein)
MLIGLKILPQPASKVRLAFAGDIMLGRDVAAAHHDGSWEDTLGVLTPYLKDTDIAFANLESPLTLAPLVGGGLDLRAPPEAVHALTAAGFHAVGLANNHALDAGSLGLEETRSNLRDVGIEPLGPLLTPWRVRSNGMNLVWFAFDDTSQALDINTIQNELDVSRDNADLIIVSIHWGSELQPAPNPRQRYVAASLAAVGADIIIGHHPHVIQSVEWVWGDGRGRPTLVVFSLGNALFDQPAPPASRYAAVLLLEAGRTGIGRVCGLLFEVDPRTWNAVPAGTAAVETTTRNIGLNCILQIQNH